MVHICKTGWESNKETTAWFALGSKFLLQTGTMHQSLRVPPWFGLHGGELASRQALCTTLVSRVQLGLLGEPTGVYSQDKDPHKPPFRLWWAIQELWQSKVSLHRLFLGPGLTCCEIWQVPWCGRGHLSALTSLRVWQPWNYFHF